MSNEWPVLVDYIDPMMWCITFMFPGLPAAIWLWMTARRAFDSTASIVLGKGLLLAWGMTVLGLLLQLLSNGWYSENSAPLEEQAISIALFLAVLAAAYISLLVTITPWGKSSQSKER